MRLEACGRQVLERPPTPAFTTKLDLRIIIPLVFLPCPWSRWCASMPLRDDRQTNRGRVHAPGHQHLGGADARSLAASGAQKTTSSTMPTGTDFSPEGWGSTMVRRSWGFRYPHIWRQQQTPDHYHAGFRFHRVNLYPIVRALPGRDRR